MVKIKENLYIQDFILSVPTTKLNSRFDSLLDILNIVVFC